MTLRIFWLQSGLHNGAKRKGFFASDKPYEKRQQNAIFLGSDPKYQEGWNFKPELKWAVPVHYPFHIATAASDYSAQNKSEDNEQAPIITINNKNDIMYF